MATENYNYTYSIDHINIEQGTFVIHYVPEDENLTPVSLNQRLLTKPLFLVQEEDSNTPYVKEEDVPFSDHLDFTIKSTAPISLWKNQYMFLNNIDHLTTANGYISL